MALDFVDSANLVLLANFDMQLVVCFTLLINIWSLPI